MAIDVQVVDKQIDTDGIRRLIINGDAIDTVRFHFPRTYNDVDLTTGTAQVLYRRPDGTGDIDLVTVESTTTEITASWDIGSDVTALTGKAFIAVRVVTETKLWQSFYVPVLIERSLAPTSLDYEPTVLDQYLHLFEVLRNEAVAAKEDAETAAQTATDVIENPSFVIVSDDLALDETSNIKIVAANIDNVNLVGGSIDNVNEVADGMEDIVAVMTHLPEINTVADNILEVNTVAGDTVPINSVATDLPVINAVNDNKTNIDAVAANEIDIDAVAGNIAHVVAVSGSLDEIDAVLAIAGNVAVVAGIDTEIVSVAGIADEIVAVDANSVNIDTVATDLALGATSKIGIVATDIANVNTVAGDIANVNAVAGNSANIDAVVANSDNINAVAGNSSNINSVAGNSENINAVVADSDDIGVVATDLGLGVASTIGIVAGSIEDVQTVAGIDTEVTALAGKTVEIDALYAQLDTIAEKENVVNKVTSWPTTPTDTEYPSAKLVDDRLSVIESANVKLYGLKMNKVTGAFTRLYDAVGKTYRQQIDTIDVPSDFSSIYPWKDMKTVKVDADKNILSVIGDANWDSVTGDKMVLTPIFWSKKWEDATDEYMVIADAPYADYLPVGFINPDGSTKRNALVGAFFTSNDGTTPHSYTDTMPKYSHPLYSATSGFQLDAMNKSANTDWSNVDSQAFEMLTRLMCIEIGSHDVKTNIGQGINGLTNSYSALNVCTVATTGANTFIMAKTRSQYFAVGMMVQIGTSHTTNALASDRYITDISEYDATNDTITVDGAVFTTTTSSTIATWAQPLPETQLQALGNESGYVLQFGAENKSHVCYRGVWDFWGNMWQFMSGLYRYDLEFYSCFDITKMNVNDPRGVAGWIATGIAPDLANGYLKTRQTYRRPEGEVGVPESVGAGATTWWGAYLYYFGTPYTGLRAVRFGGWVNGTGVSPFSWFGSSSPASSDVSIGGRLIG